MFSTMKSTGHYYLAEALVAMAQDRAASQSLWAAGIGGLLQHAEKAPALVSAYLSTIQEALDRHAA
jgi:poly-gamma-glutamate capsule biosynthesis protein CapA/YwtB (metallophosphatase superfamily)